jgi:UDPglucose 6-dehydrogenase
MGAISGALDLDLMRQQMACPVLIDLRNVYAGEDMGQRGFLYVGVGRSDGRELKRM